MKKRFLAVFGLLMLMGCSESEQKTDAIIDASDSAGKAKLVNLAALSIGMPVMALEYDKGALHVAIPVGMISINDEYADSVLNLCRSFAKHKIALGEIAILNEHADQGVFSQDVCAKIGMMTDRDSKRTIGEFSTSQDGIGPDFWKADGRAVFGPFPNNPADVLANIAATWKDPVPQVILDNLKMANPVIVDFDKGQLLAVLPQVAITQPIFNTAIVYGVCATAYGKENPWGGVNIREIFIFNQSLTQGMVFKGGAAECREGGNFSVADGADFWREKTRTVVCLDDINKCLGR